MEGPFYHPDYYAEITANILANKNLAKHHQQNAKKALAYLKNPIVSPRLKANLIEQILLKSEFKRFHEQAASVGIRLLSNGSLHNQEKASLALQLFTNKSVGIYYQHASVIKAWKELSSDQSTHSLISLAKEVIACNILMHSKFSAHYEQAILVWKSLDILTQGFMVCDILQNDSLAHHHATAEQTLEDFFSANDEIIPWYTKTRLAKIIRKTRSARLKTARSLSLEYLNAPDSDVATTDTDEEEISLNPIQKKPQRKRKLNKSSNFSYSK